MNIRLDKITTNPQQPRQDFDLDGLAALAESIKQHGLINPISVEDLGNGTYQLIDGERRWRAAKIAGLQTIEASVRPPMNGTGDRDRLALALVANIQRQEMNPAEEGHAYIKLRKLGYTLDQIGEMVGLHSSNVRNRLAITEFEPEIQALFGSRALPLHYDVIKGINELPAERRVEVMTRLASRNATISTIKTICKRIASQQEQPYVKQQGTPATRAQKGGKWDALHQVGQAPQWQVLIKAVEETCKACDLYPAASEKTCRQCPLPEMLRRLAA
jgi:ParB/RepB/Spo0J family partition protein